MIRTTVMETPIGPLALLSLDGTLVGAGFTADPRDLHRRLHPTVRSNDAGPAADLGEISAALSAYFDGHLDALDHVRVNQPGTPKRERLYAALRAVPTGTTLTYTELADKAGLIRGARAAGSACAANLIAPVVPCHRIVGANGGLTGYYYGTERKEWLLRHEHVL